MSWWMWVIYAGLVVGSMLGGMEVGAWIKHLLGRRQRQAPEEVWARPIDHIVVYAPAADGRMEGLRITGRQFLTGAVHDLDHGTLTLDLIATKVEVVYSDTPPAQGERDD